MTLLELLQDPWVRAALAVLVLGIAIVAGIIVYTETRYGDSRFIPSMPPPPPDRRGKGTYDPSESPKATAKRLATIEAFVGACEGKPPHLRLIFRPLLVSGTLADTPYGQVILVDDEQQAAEQLVALWHETIHLLLRATGQEQQHDEAGVEAMAQRLATACPEILVLLKP